MKRTTVIAVMVFAALGLNACDSSSITGTTPSVPTTSVKPSTATTEPSTVPTRDAEPTATTSEAGTPATQFAERWGKKYPAIPEFVILKTANSTCDLISSGNWQDEPRKSLIEGVVSAAGMAENDAVEFAQDAEQNYCSSRSNPT